MGVLAPFLYDQDQSETRLLMNKNYKNFLLSNLNP